MKILLVDDSPTIRAATEPMLVKMGHAVMMAENGEEALLSYKRECPDLVLMDVNMPVMDGYTAAQRIRSEYPQHWVPIIFLRGAAAGGVQCRRNLFEAFIARRMTVVVVVWLEKIDIAQGKRNCLLGASRACELGGEINIEVPPVGDLGQRVLRCQMFQLFVR